MAVPTPKVINLSKVEGRSFGFFLREEQGEEGHLIRNLELGGPAELAGMKDGDRILRVNGTIVDLLSHLQVVDLVKRSGNTVTFHILDKASYKQAKSDGVDFFNPQPRPTQALPVMNGVAGSVPKPKLCFLVKVKNEFGFSLMSTKGEKGNFMTDVTSGGVAEKAGVKAKDRIVEVNGENMEHATHQQLVDKVKASGASVMFLLADEETDSHYRNRNLKLRAELATLKHLPHKPRIAEVTKGADGYGFFLQAIQNREGHFINNVAHGGPAQEAGLRDMDRVVAVNGQEVESLDHERAVETIRQCGESCSLLVVDKETDKIYKMAGVSPLFYWIEVSGSHQQTSPAASPNGGAPTPEPAPTPPPASSQPIPDDYKPKLCKLEKTASGFGFCLSGFHGVPGQYLKEVVKGGVADRAGLEDDDVVIEVGGFNVEDSTYEQVVRRITDSGDTLTLLVIERKAYNFFKDKNIPISTLLLEQATLDTPESPDAPESSNTMLVQAEEEEEQKEEEEEKRSDNGSEQGEERQEEAGQEEEVNCVAPPSQSELDNRKASVSSSVSSCPTEDERL